MQNAVVRIQKLKFRSQQVRSKKFKVPSSRLKTENFDRRGKVQTCLEFGE